MPPHLTLLLHCVPEEQGAGYFENWIEKLLRTPLRCKTIHPPPARFSLSL